MEWTLHSVGPQPEYALRLRWRRLSLMVLFVVLMATAAATAGAAG